MKRGFLLVLCLMIAFNSCVNGNDKCTVNNLSFRDISSRNIPLVLSFQDLMELYPSDRVARETTIVRPDGTLDTLQVYQYPELGLSYFRNGDSVQLLEADMKEGLSEKEFQLGCITLNSSLTLSSLLDFFQYDSSYIVTFYQEEIPYKDTLSHPIFHAFDTSFKCSSVFYFTSSGHLRYVDFSFANGGIYP